MHLFTLAQLPVPWRNLAKVGKQSILGVVVYSLESVLALSLGTALRELLEKELLLPASQASQRRRCRGTQAPWEGMAGANSLGAGTCVEVVSKGPDSA